MPTTSVSSATIRTSSSELRTFCDAIRMSLCETMWSSLKRLSISGLKICTFCRAICARRNRRINSSLLPLNMLPVTTSIHPCCGALRTTSMAFRILSAAVSGRRGGGLRRGADPLSTDRGARGRCGTTRQSRGSSALANAALIVVDRRQVAVGRLLVEEQRQRFAAALEAAVELGVGLRKHAAVEIRAPEIE